MKVGHIADIHLKGGWDTEEARALFKAADLFIAQNVRLVCVNGDVYEDVSSPEDRLVFKDFLHRLHMDGIMTIVLRGNHDKANDLKVFDQAVPLIYHWEFEKPGFVDPPSGVEKSLMVYAIPHFSAGALALKSGSVEEMNSSGTELFTDLLENAFQNLRQHDGPRLVLFHGTVSGAKLDNDRIPRQNGIHLPLPVLESLDCPVVGGHYHKPQNVGGKVWYSGSITRQTWGEAEDDKGVLIWEMDSEGHWFPEPVFHSLNPVPMITVNAEWNGEKLIDKSTQLEIDPTSFASESKLRLRFDVPESLVHTVPKDLAARFRNSEEIKIEKTIQTTTAVRSEAMGSAITIEDSLRVWLEAKGKTPEEIEVHIREYRKVKQNSAIENSEEAAA
ncbi:calcineurin [Leptospira gomenensis]|uniref:Calcineurin n=1 Tax=Leptospira gomenensis TaxID=2484974 RepID=A0A5F1YDJ6_9LEPT|nr:metallophosphoesterase [Leptospira gomenensis]TGK36197.1 calcineurin [Leptospira gomenensis]TGK42765.1 calcineurin [Leptospira gomenensis]TGK42953.1 calcineurin [Leptospira gomenensis]TGK54964.1 calcineurin [Leptospira gomenensis]